MKLVAVGIALSTAVPAMAQDARLRVVDVGAGLCVVATAPGDHAIVYDAGRGGDRCIRAVRALVPSKKIDLLVLSHSDSDHVRETVAILDENEVATIIHPGDPRGSSLVPIRRAITDEPDADVWNLTERKVPFGRSFQVGAATATFVAGWADANETIDDDPPLDGRDEMLNNGLSIVIRFQYGGHAVLLTGDTVGRMASKDDSLCQYAERKMVAASEAVPITSEVLIGQHDSADNATSNCFIRAVRPTYVVFSAGHAYHHPRQSTADRLLANGIDKDNIFRTDRGDTEGGSGRGKEWVYGRLAGCPADGPEDDDVEISLPNTPDRPVTVAYRLERRGC